MKKVLLLTSILSLTTLGFAQTPQVEVEVKDKKEEEKASVPVKKEKKPKTESKVEGDNILIQSGAGGVNIFKSVELAPSVNVQTDDPYGLGGGSIRIRGFDNTQIGLTIDNMPLNDSGNFALYPHEYIDTENLESVNVERGSVSKRSPFYTEIGGAIRLRTKPPKNKVGFEYNLRGGSFGFHKEFFRFDTGKLPLGFKIFGSFSHTTANKWKGPGKNPDYRDHTTIGIAQNFNRLRWEFYFDNNAQFNYFYRSLNYSQTRNLDNYKFDYNSNLIFPGGSGLVHNNASIRDNNVNYYKFYTNPYFNRQYRANINFDITDSISLNIKPYYWWGRGSGTSATTFTSGGNTYIAFRESFNYTDRPGFTTELKINTLIGSVYLGYWFERAELKQWQPSRPVKVNPDGTYDLLTNTTGTPRFQYNYIQKTITTTNTPYVNFDLNNLLKKLDIEFGFRYAQIKREFKNYNTTNLPYLSDDNIYDYPNLTQDLKNSYNKTYRKLLPNLNVGSKITDNFYMYFSYAKNFRAPQNFIGTIPTNLPAQYVVDQLKPEESDSFDLGFRFDMSNFYVAPTVYYVRYKNRLIRTVDPNDPTLVYLRNAGKVIAQGAELEIGYSPNRNFSLYTSASYNVAKFKDDVFYDGNTKYDIKDKNVPDTPAYMLKLGVDSRYMGFKIRPSIQYIGSRYGNFINTEKVNSYTLVNLYVEKDIAPRKLATLYVDVYNLTDTRFIGRINPGTATGSYYIGAPLAISVGIKGRF